MAEENKETVELELPPGVTEEALQKALTALAKKPVKKEAEPVIFNEWESGYNQKIKVYRGSFKGKLLNYIQKFWLEEASGEYKHGKAVTFDYEDIPEILEGLEKMKEYLEENPND